MKRFLFVAAVAAVVTAPAIAADVGVSVNIGQPGFYGRIDIGNFPQPQLVYPQPVIIQPAPVYVDPEPLYLYVPPSHQRNWRRYCGRYNACGQPVYFVRDDWYQQEYVPRYREEHGEHGEHHHAHHHDGDDRGEGHGHGHGNGRGHGDD